MSTKDIKLHVSKQNIKSKKGEKINTKAMEEFTSKTVQPTVFILHLKHNNILYVVICSARMFFLAFYNVRVCYA